MANGPISGFPAVTTPHSADLIYLVDSTNVSQSAQGTSSQISLSNLLVYINANLSPSTPLTVAQGGTGHASLTSGDVLVGNGTGAVSLVATTGSGNVVLATSPTLVTPTLGAAIATSINNVAITAPASSATLTIANGKTLTANNTITISGTDGKSIQINNSLILAGTDSTTMTFPGSSDTVTGIGATQTLTNKRITRRTVTTTQSATPAIDTDNGDIFTITGLAQAITSMTSSLTGTPNDGDLIEIRITDNGTGRAITWGTSFESTGNVTLPVTTVASTILRIGLEWNAAASKWDCIALA